MNIQNLLKSEIPSTSGRVPEHTKSEVNARIRAATLARLDEIGMDREKIDARLGELEREWDIERALQVNAATAALIGLSLGAKVSRKWFLFPAIVAGFLLQHAIQGWCPPLPVLRRWGVRTAREIEEERMILKARRGDLTGLEGRSGEEALRMVSSRPLRYIHSSIEGSPSVT